MKIKFVYYSLTGNTKQVIEAVGLDEGAIEISKIELKAQKEYPNAGFKKYFWGGKSVVFKETPKLEAYDFTAEQDLLIVATPIWASTFSPPIRTFLKENSLAGQKVAFVVCHKGGGVGKCFTDFKQLQPEAILVDTIDFVEPKESGISGAAEKLQDWIKGLI